MRELGPNTQPKCDPRQHDGRIDRRNAQDHPSLGVRPYSPPPPSPATPTAMPTRVILPYPWHDATWRWHVPCARDHAHAGTSARPRNDEFCAAARPRSDEFCQPAVPAKHCKLKDVQQPAQQTMPMMAPYYAPNQHPYYAPNQQQQSGYF